MKHIINDHLIDVPNTMQVKFESGFPGAHDYIVYKGFNIYTQDVEDYDDEVYAGRFYVEDGWGALREVKTLKEAASYIDECLVVENV